LRSTLRVFICEFAPTGRNDVGGLGDTALDRGDAREVVFDELESELGLALGFVFHH